KLVEPTLLQQLVQPLVERMCPRPRPLRVGNPKLFLRLPLLRSSSHRHARSLRTSALDYARNFTSESRLSPRTASRATAFSCSVFFLAGTMMLGWTNGSTSGLGSSSFCVSLLR